MSELSNLITILKGNRTAAEIVKGTGISREKFRQIERGYPVSLKILRKIKNHLKLENRQWLQIIIAWAKGEIGEESSRINFHIPDVPLQDSDDELRQISEQAAHLSQIQRQQILSVIKRPQVLDFLKHLNSFHDSVKKMNR